MSKGVGKVKRSEHRKLILPILLKDGKLTLKELEERTFTYTYHFHAFGYTFHNKLIGKLYNLIPWLKHPAKWRETAEEKVNIEMKCKRLIENGLIRLGLFPQLRGQTIQGLEQKISKDLLLKLLYSFYLLLSSIFPCKRRSIIFLGR